MHCLLADHAPGAAEGLSTDSGDKDYTRDAESEADDEATLDEEERAAQAEGADTQVAACLH